MELDFTTVKALSSRTRIKILNETISSESTPTDISNSIGRSKSTVSSHLSKLQKAGLVEKEEVEGRRRVIYRPTDKTEKIMKGKDQKVKFSILSSASSIWIALGLSISSLKDFFGNTASTMEEQSSQMGTMALDKSTTAAQSGSEGVISNLQPADALLFVGLGFLSIAIAGLVYGLMVSKIGDQD